RDSSLRITATPANSPEGTRPGSPEPATYKLPGLDDLTKHFHAGASFLKRTIYGRTDPSNPSSPPGDPKINLVERVQALGVERLVCHSGYPQSVGGVVTSRVQATPPLLHLSNLIRSSAKPTPSDAQSPGISSITSSRGSIMSTPKITSPGERRPQIPPGAPLGIPGHPGAGHLGSRLTQLKPGQRAD
ncbi:UNVERIFIED_CONTAM: hypothetical protein GTU68_049943, partial [Idotea baltica]|nr:hypothetical protein [Idotea baltica]